MRSTTIFAVLTLAATTALAQNAQQPFFNVVTLDASATAEVPNDTLTATLFVEEQGPDPGQLAAKVNARLDEALAHAKAQPKIEARSGNYQTTPVYDRANQITGWRIRADIVIESREFKTVGALAGTLQPALKLLSMTFSLSRASRQAAEATLLTEALGKFQEKARAVAKGLGFPGYMLGQLSIRSESSTPPTPMVRGVAMSASMDVGMPTPVPAEGGKNAVTVYVAGSVVLGPGK